ncbi:hypothetical protein J8C02_06275 [Chloracidobacterium sp. MS 40/45]|jgi:DNA-binding Lrp family transcriptional regulator|uniref:hypothetical protein n=1 Tax=Chloracidobacterium aggregatum TaxID=2851959 RepID=UPI001B8C37E8|nr:hypothetical protein [Chloracidobacterium aggregatum]QUV99043.1 hypothetical protein J8C02_06275 [Chloracidobacterium sp. MS 40/45]
MDEQFPYMADGLAYLAQVENLRQSSPQSPYLSQPDVIESYQRWQNYFQTVLVTPAVHLAFLSYLGQLPRPDLVNYLRQHFPLTGSQTSSQGAVDSGGRSGTPTTPPGMSGSGGVIPLDRLIEEYRREQTAQRAATPAGHAEEEDTEIERSLTPDRPLASLIHLSKEELLARVERLEQDNRSLRRRLQVKLGRRDVSELEAVVAEYERRMREAEQQLDELRRITQDSGKFSGQFEDISVPPDGTSPEAERQKLEKKYQKTLAEVAILAQGMLNHLTTFLNDKACMVGPGEQSDIVIKFPEMQAPVVQMIRKLKQIEDLSKRRCGIPELNELVDQLFGSH